MGTLSGWPSREREVPSSFLNFYLWVPQQGGLPTGGKSETMVLGRASGVFLSIPCFYMRIPVLEVVGLFSVDQMEEPANGLTSGQVFLMTSLSKHVAFKTRTFFHLTTTPLSCHLALLQ